jgi:hypothetical protein
MLRIDLKDQAAGVNVNLRVGLALLVACAVLWGWALTRPLSEELSERDAADGTAPAGLDE